MIDLDQKSISDRTTLEECLVEAYSRLDLYKYDIIYIYSDFRKFGNYLPLYSDKSAFCEAFLSPILSSGKTIIMPSFTYTTSGVFDLLSTETNLGTLNRYFSKSDKAVRSEHPLFSYVAVGPAAKMIENIGKSAFGAHSVFHRLRGKNTGFLHIGRPISFGNTLVHFVEQSCGASYRQNKVFSTIVRRGSTYIGTDYSAFLRRRDVENEDFATDFNSTYQKLKASGLLLELGSPDKLSNLSTYPYDETLDFLTDLFYKDAKIFLSSSAVIS